MKSFIQYSTEKKNELDEDITWMQWANLLSWGMVAYIWFNAFSRVELANKDYPESPADLKQKIDNLSPEEKEKFMQMLEKEAAGQKTVTKKKRTRKRYPETPRQKKDREAYENSTRGQWKKLVGKVKGVFKK